MNFGGSGDVNIAVGGDLNPLEQALQQIPVLARQAGEAAAQALSAATSSGSGAAGAFDAAATATRNLSDAMNVAVGAAVDLDKELQNKQVDAGGAAQAFGDLGKQLSDAGAAMVLIGGALSVVSAGLVELGESSLMAAGKMEQQRVAMVNLTHSASETDTLIRGLVDFAVKTPFEIPGVVEMGQKLVAMGTATKDVIPLLTTLGDTASGSGKGFAGLNTLVNDFGKIAQTGVVHMRDLNTLAQQGVPAIQALADAFGVSANRMRQMVEQNLVAATDALPILIKAMNEKFGGMMEAQSKTFLGMWSNFKDTITKTLIGIGDALIPAAKGLLAFLQPLLDVVQKLAEGFGQLPIPVQALALALGTMAIVLPPIILAFGGFLLVVGNIITKLPALAGVLGVELPAAFAASGTAAVGATAKMEAASLANTALTTSLSVLGKAVGVVSIAFVAWELGRWASDNIPAVNNLTAALQAMVDVGVQFSKLKPMFDGFGAGISAFAGALTGANKELHNQLQGVDDLNAALKSIGVTVERGNKNWDQYRAAVIESAKEHGLFTGALEKAIITMNSTAMAVEALTRKQKDADEEVERTRGAMNAMIALQSIGERSTQDVTRATIEYEAALKKANPAIKEHGAAIRDASNYVNEAAKAMDAYSSVIQKFPGYVTGSMTQFRRAIIDGFNPDTAIKSIDSLIAKMDALAADGDKNAASISEFFQKGRKDILDMLLSLDPTKMQQFEVNGVQVLKSGIDGLGESAKTMAAKLATALNMPESSAQKLIDAWKIGMRDAAAATDGFTTSLKNIPIALEASKTVEGLATSVLNLGDSLGETVSEWARTEREVDVLMSKWTDATTTVIPGVDGQVKILTGSMSKLAGATKDVGEAMVFTGGQWIKGTELAGQFTKAVNDAKAASGDLGKAAMGGSQAAAQAMADEKKSTDALMMSATEFQRNYGGSMKAAESATTSADKAFQAFGSTVSKMSGSFMEGMTGMTASGEQYIAMLAQLGAPDGMLAQTARAFGYIETGIRQYVNEAQALKMSLSPQQDALTKFFFGGSTGDLISSLKAFSDALHPTSKAVADLGTASTQVATDIPKVFQPLADTVGGTVKVFQPLTYSANAAAQALGAVGDAASGTATGMKTFQDLLGDSNTQIKGTADMFRDFPEEMGKAKGQTLQNLVNLGVNFYDAATATNAFTDAAVDASKMIRSASATVAGDAANQTDFAKYVLAMGQKDMADYLADPMSKRDMSATSKSGVDPATQTPFAQAMLAAAQADMAAFLASGTNAPRAGSSMVANPNSMYSGGRKTLGDISAPVGLMAQSNGGVTINVIQPTVMDMGMVNSLTNKVATQMTNILRQNAGLKV